MYNTLAHGRGREGCYHGVHLLTFLFAGYSYGLIIYWRGTEVAIPAPTRNRMGA